MDLSRIPEPLRSRLEEQLSRLPAEVRSSLERKLANLPAGQLEAVLAKTSPMLEKLAAAKSPGHSGSGSAGRPSNSGSSGGSGTVGGTGTIGVAGSPKPQRRTGTGPASTTGSMTGQGRTSPGVFDQHNHYNNTIQRGDRDSPPFFVIVFLIACFVIFARTLGWFAS